MQAKRSTILVWLTRDRLPTDLYELLGAARLDPDANKLRALLRQANRDLLGHLDNPDSKLAERAALLQTELARADRILADPARRRIYETRLIRALRDRYVKKHGNVRDAGAAAELKAWLEKRIRVHPARVDAVMRAIGLPQDAPARPSSAAARKKKPAPTVPPTGSQQDDLLEGWRPPIDDPAGLIRRSQRVSTRSHRIAATVGAVAGAVILGVGVYVALTHGSPGGTTGPAGSSALETTSITPAEPPAVTAPASEAESKTPLAPETRPLDLRLLPAGSRVLLAARPAALATDAAARDVVRGLGPWADAALAALRRLIPLDPDDVDRVLVASIPAASGAPPDRAAVVRLAREIAREELLETFGDPEPATALSEEQYFVDTSARTAYYFADPRTIAIFPKRFAREVLGDVRTPLPTSPDLEALVEHSDRDSVFSVVFDARFLREEAGRVLDAETHDLVMHSLDVLGDEVAAGLLSLDTGESLRAKLVVRGGRDVRPSNHRRELEERLRYMPYDLLETVKTMRPPRRSRRLVGRFPAMVKALVVVLEVEEDAGSIVARAHLPERAGPNLALAGRLTWQEYQAERSAETRSSN